MFFSERIKSIKEGDFVLEIGPGGGPYYRSDVLLEKVFDNPEMAETQRGYAPELKTGKKVVYYDGGKLPFNDKEFDYVICSHVLEHVEDVDAFILEINRVCKAGYIEYPLIYYDYIYNFPEHITLLKKQQDLILWMPKKASGLSMFESVNTFFYESLKSQYTTLVDELKRYFFEGFEWFDLIKSRRTDKIEDLVLHDFHIPMRPENQTNQPGFFQRLRQIIKSGITQ